MRETAIKFGCLSFLLIYTASVLEASEESIVLEKLRNSQLTMNFIKTYCNITEDYDNLVVCRCKAGYYCEKKQFENCASQLNIVYDRILAYMFIYCSGHPPIKDKLERGVKNRPSRKRFQSRGMCQCKYLPPIEDESTTTEMELENSTLPMPTIKPPKYY